MKGDSVDVGEQAEAETFQGGGADDAPRLAERFHPVSSAAIGSF